MPSNLYQTVLFGSSKAGLSTVGYRLYNGDGTPASDRITSGVQDLTGGQYGAIIEIPDDFVGRIRWDTGEATPVYASAELNTPDNEAIVNAAVETVVAAVQDAVGNIIVRPDDRVIIGPRQQCPATIPQIYQQQVRSGYRRPVN